jgi:hypothetical protein
MPRQTRRQFLALTALAAGAAAIEAAPAPDQAPAAPRFSYRIKKASEDAIAAVPGKDEITFRVSSRSGIGAAEIILEEGTWPRQIVLELGLWNLEHFAVGNGVGEQAVILSGRLQERPKTVLHYDRKGRPTRDTSAAVYTLTIVQREQRVIDMILPPGFAGAGTKKLEFDWIDAFRR